MKTTKKIFAALLAVMMLLVMVPFSASAATNISFDLSCEKEGYEFAVYQVATLNKTAGKYENILNIAGLSDEINDKGENTASIVSILDTAYAADANVFGTAKATFKSVDKYKLGLSFPVNE